jgi:hypothetical protein
MRAKKHFEEDVAPTRIENVPTAEIRADQLVQSRARLDPAVIAEYTEAMVGGVEFPPLGVVRVGDEYLLFDGFLRFEAAKLANKKVMRCEVRRGDLRAALLLSAAANAQHGLRRTWNDKRRAAGKLLNDAEWSKWSDREIARRCLVSHEFVSRLRGELLTVNVDSESSVDSALLSRRFVSRHGTASVMTITAIGKPAPPAAPITFGPPQTSRGDVISLSDFTQDHREQFVDAVRQAEGLLAGLPAVTLVRGDYAADVVLAKRLKALAEKAASLAAFLLRGREAG